GGERRLLGEGPGPSCRFPPFDRSDKSKQSRVQSGYQAIGHHRPTLGDMGPGNMADGEPATEVGFGDMLRRLRGVTGLTQAQLAVQSGITVQAISLLERRERQRPHPRTVQQLADALSLTGADRARFEAAAWPVRNGHVPSGVKAPSTPFRAPAAAAPIIGRDDELTALAA